jgi:predicted nucleic acid-binding protein
VLSELGKKLPNPGVVTFMNSLTQSSLYISVVSLGEIAKGIEMAADLNKKNQLSAWLEKICSWFDGNIINLDQPIFTEWGRLVGSHNRTLPVLDSLIAATCLNYHFTLITRNVKDFADIKGLACQNPWA